MRLVTKSQGICIEANYPANTTDMNALTFFMGSIRMTKDQKKALKEFDAQQERLEQQLKALLERRRELININQLNEKVGVK